MTRNAQDIIDDMRNIVKPRIAEMLLEANFEECGKEDKAEFETEFEMILTLAGKALDQEPCKDAISRQAALDIYDDYNVAVENGELEAYRKHRNRLLKLPPVTPQSKWIPVSEGLPEDGIYLVTVERIGGVPIIETKSFAKDLHRVHEYDFPKHKCGWYDYDSEYGYWEDTNVIAWMPLPQPYKVESEVDKG